jgi:hypothetical protein
LVARPSVVHGDGDRDRLYRPSGAPSLGRPKVCRSIRVNTDADTQARKLLDDGTFDDKTEWSQAAPNADDANKDIDTQWLRRLRPLASGYHVR